MCSVLCLFVHKLRNHMSKLHQIFTKFVLSVAIARSISCGRHCHPCCVALVASGRRQWKVPRQDECIVQRVSGSHLPSTVVACHVLVEVEQGLTSHQTHYRSYRGRVLWVKRPNQQCQSTEGREVLRTRFQSH